MAKEKKQTAKAAASDKSTGKATGKKPKKTTKGTSGSSSSSSTKTKWKIKAEDFMKCLEEVLEAKGSLSDLTEKVRTTTKPYNGRLSVKNCTEDRVYARVVKLRKDMGLKLPLKSDLILTDERKAHWKDRLKKYGVQTDA